MKDFLTRSSLVFPRLKCRSWVGDSAYRREVEDLLRLGVGGFILFEGNQQEVAQAIAEVRQSAPGPILMAADCEFGLPMRFEAGTEFPSMWAYGAADDLSATYATARAIAEEMNEIGIDWNLAPVADVNSREDNPIVNIRSFGPEPELVGRHVAAYVRGIQDGGIIACAKHFPGHGSTSVDSHNGLPTIDSSLEELRQRDLPPFVEACRSGVQSIMLGHLDVPAIDPDRTPATLSPRAVAFLRTELEFDGVIITDALEMEALSGHADEGGPALAALKAGCDVLEIPTEPKGAIEAIDRAAARGELDENALDRSLARLAALIESRRSAGDPPSGRLDSDEHRLIALESARRSLRRSGDLSLPEKDLVVLAFADDDDERPAEWFGYLAGSLPGDPAAAVVTPSVTGEELADISKAAESGSGVLLGLFVKPVGGRGDIDLAERQSELLKRLDPERVILLNYGNPFLRPEFRARGRIDVFSAAPASIAASVEAVVGAAIS